MRRGTDNIPLHHHPRGEYRRTQSQRGTGFRAPLWEERPKTRAPLNRYCPHDMMMMRVMIVMVVILVIKMEMTLLMRDEEVRVGIKDLGKR